jgi:hypothetical protein
MMITVCISDGGESLYENVYFKGEISECPPLPRKGDEIVGEFGHGEVTKIKHFREARGFRVVIEFGNVETRHKHTSLLS